MTKTKFDVGDKVRSREFGLGIVTKVYPKEITIPIEVTWVEKPAYFGYYDRFTSNGQYYEDGPDAKKRHYISKRRIVSLLSVGNSVTHTNSPII